MTITTNTVTPEPDYEGLRRKGYAYGNYTCACHSCEREFLGAKGANCCQACAERKLANEKFTDSLRKTKKEIDDLVEQKADQLLESLKICGEILFMPQGGMDVTSIVTFVHPKVFDAIKRKMKDAKDVKG